jgi:hypothetical protein
VFSTNTWFIIGHLIVHHSFWETFLRTFLSHIWMPNVHSNDVFSHFSRRHKTQRCSSSLYIKDSLFINAVHTQSLF